MAMMGCRIPVAGIASILLVATAAPPSAAAQGSHDALIAKHAAAHGIPESLVRRVIHIESRGNPRAVSKGNYGLMQIRLGTARAMGYRGDANGLLDADTNMTYAVKYLAGAYRTGGCNAERAIRNYQKGYHGVRRYNCATPQPARTAVASAAPAVVPVQQTATNGTALVEAAFEVLKPRVVQTVAVSRRDLRPLPAAKVATVNPRAVTSPPLPVARPRPVAAPAVAAASAPEPAALAVQAPAAVAPSAPAAQASARPDAAPVPLPPVKIARLDPAPGNDTDSVRAAKPDRKAERKSQRKPARTAVTAGSNPASELVALVKKLVTPDKRSRARVQRFDQHTQN